MGIDGSKGDAGALSLQAAHGLGYDGRLRGRKSRKHRRRTHRPLRYADLLATMQGLPPEYMYVVAPWSEFQPQQYRFANYAAYFRKVKRALQTAMAVPTTDGTYPDPIEHCDICRWREACDKRRRNDDHLCLVAGISKIQINELKARGIATVQGLSGMSLPLDWKPDRGSADSYIRIREQARIVVEARAAGAGKFELLPVE